MYLLGSLDSRPFPLRARFNCAGVGKSKLGMIRHSRTVPCASVVQAWHVIFLISGFFDSLFLADSGGEDQDDWLLG